MKAYLKFKSQNASIALISLLVISVFTLILVVAMSEVNISSSYQRLNTESGKLSYYAAEGCFEEAAHRLEEDTGFNSATLEYDSDTSCSIVVTGTAPYVITVTVNYLNYVERYQANAYITSSGEGTNLSLGDWQEI